AAVEAGGVRGQSGHRPRARAREGAREEKEGVTAPDPRRAIDAVWRIEAPRLIAGLARMVRDVGLAEDLAQDALVAALQQWPESGVPDNPGAWLMAIGKRRAIDHFRRAAVAERRREEIGRELEGQQAVVDLDAAIDDDFG